MYISNYLRNGIIFEKYKGRDFTPALMFSQRNNPYCELLSHFIILIVFATTLLFLPFGMLIMFNTLFAVLYLTARFLLFVFIWIVVIYTFPKSYNNNYVQISNDANNTNTKNTPNNFYCSHISYHTFLPLL